MHQWDTKWNWNFFFCHKVSIGNYTAYKHFTTVVLENKETSLRDSKFKKINDLTVKGSFHPGRNLKVKEKINLLSFPYCSIFVKLKFINRARGLYKWLTGWMYEKQLKCWFQSRVYITQTILLSSQTMKVL